MASVLQIQGNFRVIFRLRVILGRRVVVSIGGILLQKSKRPPNFYHVSKFHPASSITSVLNTRLFWTFKNHPEDNSTCLRARSTKQEYERKKIFIWSSAHIDNFWFWAHLETPEHRRHRLWALGGKLVLLFSLQLTDSLENDKTTTKCIILARCPTNESRRKTFHYTFLKIDRVLISLLSMRNRTLSKTIL